MPRALVSRALALLALVLTPPGVATAQYSVADAVMAQVLDKLVAADKYPFKFDAERAKAVRAECTKWHRAAGLDVFEKGPGAKAAWADKARAVLELDAHRLAQAELSGAPAPRIDALAHKLAQEAVAAGCDDSLVRYLAEYKLVRGDNIDTKIVAKFRETVTALDASKYGNAYKVYASYNLSVALRGLPGADPLRKDVEKWEKRFWELFEQVAADPHPSAGAIVFDLARRREDWLLGPDRTRRQNYEEVAKHLEAAKAPKAVRLVVEARLLSREGWAARGTGVVASVGPDAGKIFKERVAASREKYEEAWAADKNRHQTATDMIKTCRDLGLSRDEMETWFARALELNPDNRQACVAKLDRLSPRWGGSNEELGAFVWMCARSENVEGLIPMAVVDYDMWLNPAFGPAFEANRAPLEAFYARPVIWVPVHTALNRMLQTHPDDVHTRTLYARLACLAGRNSVAVAQFEKLAGKYDPKYFPGKGEFERFAEAAKAGVFDPAKLVGTWTLKGSAFVVKFAKDGTFKTIPDPSTKGEPEEGMYKLDGNQLILATGKGERGWTVVKLTGEALVFKDAVMGEPLEFSREKEK